MTNPLTAPMQPDRLRGQMSRPNLSANPAANPFDGRGRGRAAARRAHGRIGSDREAFLRQWSLLMIASFASREACAVHFGVTFQAACNWFDGANAPYGHHVAHAVRTLPRYGEIMG